MRTAMLFLLLASLSATETNVYPVVAYRVIDGDTIEVVLDLGFDLQKKASVRLAGINTPEIRGEEREDGLAVKAQVVEYLAGKNLVCQWLSKGKYAGRFIGRLYVDDKDLSAYLLEQKLAKPYEEGE